MTTRNPTKAWPGRRPRRWTVTAAGDTVRDRVRGGHEVESPERGVRAAWDRMRNGKLGEVFGADLRSLAIFRIVLGLLVLMDLAGRVRNLRVHYTDEGVLPRDTAMGMLNPWRWSISLFNGTEAAQWLLFFAAAAAAGFLIVGYHTRIATIVAWVLLVSIQTRNPLVLSGADTLLRVLLFWAMLLPLGAYWSLDRSLQGPSRQPMAGLSPMRCPVRCFSWATAGLFLQIAFMYWFTAILKTSPSWRTEGTALSYATGAGQVTRPFGEYLHQFPDLLRFLTHASYALEVAVPFLLFSPFRTGPVRTLAAATIMAFHAGIFLTFNIGIFPWTSALCMVCFLPAWFWDRALPVVRAAAWGRSRALWRSGGLATQAAHRAAHQAAHRAAHRVAHQALLRAGAPGAVATGGRPETAGATFASAVSTPASSPPAPAPSPARPAARTGMVLGSSPLTNLFAAFCLLFVLGWNVATVSDFTVPAQIRPFGHASGLYQTWDMFSPMPPSVTKWHIVRGTLEDGQQIDLLTPVILDDLTRIGPISWERPDDIAGDYYHDKYWRKYLDSIATEGSASATREFVAYTCRMWNDTYRGSVALKSIDILTASQRTSLSGEEYPVRRSLHEAHTCVSLGS